MCTASSLAIRTNNPDGFSLPLSMKSSLTESKISQKPDRWQISRIKQGTQQWDKWVAMSKILEVTTIINQGDFV